MVHARARDCNNIHTNRPRVNAKRECRIKCATPATWEYLHCSMELGVVCSLGTLHNVDAPALFLRKDSLVSVGRGGKEVGSKPLRAPRRFDLPCSNFVHSDSSQSTPLSGRSFAPSHATPCFPCFFSLYFVTPSCCRFLFKFLKESPGNTMANAPNTRKMCSLSTFLK